MPIVPDQLDPYDLGVRLKDLGTGPSSHTYLNQTVEKRFWKCIVTPVLRKYKNHSIHDMPLTLGPSKTRTEAPSQHGINEDDPMSGGDESDTDFSDGSSSEGDWSEMGELCGTNSFQRS